MFTIFIVFLLLKLEECKCLTIVKGGEKGERVYSSSLKKKVSPIAMWSEMNMD